MKRGPNSADQDIEPALAAGLRSMGLENNAQKQQQLCAYIRLLVQWNRSYNLTAIEHAVEMVPRHLLDSLSIAEHLQGQRFLDVGTGAGLPGIPLAIWFPQRQFHLLDSNGKKIRFLFEVKRNLGLANVSLHQCRAEDLRDESGFDAILSRALASVATMVTASEHLLAPGACFLAMKGELAPGELEALTNTYTLRSRTMLTVPGIAGTRQLLCIARA